MREINHLLKSVLWSLKLKNKSSHFLGMDATILKSKSANRHQPVNNDTSKSVIIFFIYVPVHSPSLPLEHRLQKPRDTAVCFVKS